jgi:transposase
VRHGYRFQVVVSKSRLFCHTSVLMKKYKEIFGVDIRKDVFDIYGSKSDHNQFKNNPSGFKSFLKSLPKELLVVLEATGYYQLAYHLLESGIKVSVENPLSVQRFIQMKLAKVKTDKAMQRRFVCMDK